jgi:glycosyltransferase involved in cell wall biosynthesis
MRILIVHNSYQQRGGEDIVVEAESGLMTSRGHEVHRFTRHNDDVHRIGRAKLAVQALWSRQTVQALDGIFKTFRPDVVHAHNTWSLVSPSVYWAAAAAHVPTVNTLHNFRLVCPQATFLRNNARCEDCLGNLPWRGAIYGCYRNSRAQTTVLAAMLTLHRGVGTYRNKITRYIALSEFARRKFVEGGLPADRIVVKPNFVDLESPAIQPRNGLLFVGRLSAEKGVGVLVQAAAVAGVPVRVAGTGPEAALLAGVTTVQGLGELSAEAVHGEMEQALALVLPSICYENFPRALVEAFASGLPVIASNLGPLRELVDDGVTGLLFEAGDSSDLARKMHWAQANPQRMTQMGVQARAKYEAEFTADRNYEQLLAIYRGAIAEVAATYNPPARRTERSLPDS